MKRAWLIALWLLLAVAGAWWLLRPTPQQTALRSRELATRGLAAHLAARFPGQRALVLSNPYTRRPGLAKGIYAQEQAGLRGLEKGFGRAISVAAVGFPELKPEAQENPLAVEMDPSSPTPLSYLVTDESLDKLVQAHPDCELVVSLIGLPAALGRVQAWRTESRVKFALLFPDLRLLGGAAAVRDAVQSGKLAALVLPKPGAPADQSAASRDFTQEFERRFLLVTPDTVDETIATYPQLFGLATR